MVSKEVFPEGKEGQCFTFWNSMNANMGIVRNILNSFIVLKEVLDTPSLPSGNTSFGINEEFTDIEGITSLLDEMIVISHHVNDIFAFIEFQKVTH